MLKRTHALVVVALLLLPFAPGSVQAAPTKTATPPQATVAPIPVGQKARCPVSGEEFTVTANTAQAIYKGKSYAFCCPDCKPSFVKHPQKYVSGSAATAKGCPSSARQASAKPSTRR